ncbi:MAG: hypothetical protein OEL57_15065 [Trichlorobacter sp.]|nr:hypothetical protein [Trichlorobacter sp.]MDK9719204.1 hypothetical protein [Trichlorobacter sp.]
MKNLILYLLFMLAMTVFCPHRAEAVQPRTPQLLYPSSKRIVIFVADG